MTQPVVTGALCVCDKGSAPCPLIGTNAPAVLAESMAVLAAITDHVQGTNLAGFGTCAVTQSACSPATPAPWNPGLVSILIVGGAPVLSALSLLTCAKGGTIRVADPGQQTIAAGALKTVPGYEARNGNDALIADLVARFNAEKGWSPGDPNYLDPNLVKAWALTESGSDADKDIYDHGDMMQMNNPGDWSPDKTRIAGITQGQQLTPAESLDAALKFAYWKGSIHDAQGHGNFQGWPRAIDRYGPGKPEYWDKVHSKYNSAK